MKILAIYLITINLILFGMCSKHSKNKEMILQSVLFFIPTLMLCIYVILRA